MAFKEAAALVYCPIIRILLISILCKWPLLAGCRPMRPSLTFLDSGRSRLGVIDP